MYKFHIHISTFLFIVMFKLLVNYYLFFKFYMKFVSTTVSQYTHKSYIIQIWVFKEWEIFGKYSYLSQIFNQRKSLSIYLSIYVFVYLRALCFGIQLKLYFLIISFSRETKYKYTTKKITIKTSKLEYLNF